ncbi:MAG: heme exporter protein CcmB [Leptospira sp.]|nr:heme exporter protein CcmB [Leptospira sp.]
MIFALLKKEFLIVGKSLHGLLSMIVLAFTLLFLFHFSFEKERSLDFHSLVGVKWAVVFLVSFVLIGQATWEERESGAGKIVLMLVPGWLQFIIKSVSVWILLMVVEVIFLFGMTVFFTNMSQGSFWNHFIFLIPGSLSLSFLGVSLGGFSGASRMKEIVLPLLLVPFSIPIFLYGLNAEFRWLTQPESLYSSFFLLVFFCFFYGGLGALFQELQSEDMDG